MYYENTARLAVEARLQGRRFMVAHYLCCLLEGQRIMKP
jgi:hypothetical protein